MQYILTTLEFPKNITLTILFIFIYIYTSYIDSYNHITDIWNCGHRHLQTMHTDTEAR